MQGVWVWTLGRELHPIAQLKGCAFCNKDWRPQIHQWDPANQINTKILKKKEKNWYKHDTQAAFYAVSKKILCLRLRGLMSYDSIQ